MIAAYSLLPGAVGFIILKFMDLHSKDSLHRNHIPCILAIFTLDIVKPLEMGWDTFFLVALECCTIKMRAFPISDCILKNFSIIQGVSE